MTSQKQSRVANCFIFMLFMVWARLSYGQEFSPISIEKITSIVEADTHPTHSRKNFSLQIKFKVANRDLVHWAFGFYQPKTYKHLVDKARGLHFNPDLSLELCEPSSPRPCSKIKYLTKSQPYSSAGYTHVFVPVNPSFVLEKGKSYLFKINDSNQGAPGNYSALPQSFFIIEKGQKVTALAEALPEQYEMGGYRADETGAAIRKHKNAVWLQAKPLESASLADRYHLVPSPLSIRALKQNGFVFRRNTKLSIRDEFEDGSLEKILAAYLRQDLNIYTFKAVKLADLIFKKSKRGKPEGYRIDLSQNKIVIEADTTAGAFYALQTLRQLWNQSQSLPSLRIEDYPRYKYRGLLIDVSRHFFSVKELEKIIDLMAALKLNSLHLHFADDEGWRLDLSQSPQDSLKKLITRGSVRGFSKDSILEPAVFGQANLDLSNHEAFVPLGRLIQKKYPPANQPYAGHYSQEDLKTLIFYANARKITIIPEMELPGHARSLMYSLPSAFRNNKDKTQYLSAQGYDDNVFPICLYGREAGQGKLLTLYLDQIIERLNTLFSKQTTLYNLNELSVGGDEVSSHAWEEDESCKESEAWRELSASAKAQHFFSLLQQRSQSRLSGWQQLVQTEDGLLGKEALSSAKLGHVWVWEKADRQAKSKGIIDAAALANAGYPTVLAFADDTYFDLTYTADKWEPGFRWAGAYLDTAAALRIALDASYTEKRIVDERKANILGLEGALWSENLMNFSHLSYMMLPKITGLAEAAWSSAETTTSSEDKLNWRSLAYRLGRDNKGFLGFLFQRYNLKYRGYPHGVSQELPGV